MKTHTSILFLLLLARPVFSQFNSLYEKLFEFEAQRYLMSEIYEVNSSKVDELRIDHIYSENDGEFILRLTAYDFDGKQGVILTSLNSYDVVGDLYRFRNIHLTREEIEDLNSRLNFMGINQRKKDVNLLQRFNERLIFEVAASSVSGLINYNLWIDNLTKHSFTKDTWDKSFQRLQEFFQK